MFLGYCQFNFSFEHPQVTTPANKRRFIRKLKEFLLNLYWAKTKHKEISEVKAFESLNTQPPKMTQN